MKRLLWLGSLLVILGVAIAPPVAALDGGSLLGLWLFDDGGDPALDSSGNGNDAMLVNGPKYVPGKFGDALEFRAADASYAIAPIQHSDTVTVMVWVNYATLASNNIGIVHFQNTDNAGGDPGTKIIGMWVEKSSLLWGRIIPKGAGNVNFPKNEKLDQDTWYHIAMVVDAAAGKATQWVDGEVVGEVDYPGQLTEFSFIKIGRQGTETWDGMLDEVAVFNVALSQDEIKSAMNGMEQALAVSARGKVATTWARIKEGR